MEGIIEHIVFLNMLVAGGDLEDGHDVPPENG
jgi:hypothetical protein